MKKATKKSSNKAATTNAPPFDVYQMVTDKILKQIEESGKLSWVKPWSVSSAAGGQWPMNGKTKRRYDGVNFFLLQFSEYTSPYWLTFKQVEELGGNIRKGEKCTQIVFWKINVYKEEATEAEKEKTKKVPLLRYYNVWNVEQCDNITIETPAAPVIEVSLNERLEISESVINQYGAIQPALTIQVKESDRAFYQPSRDLVNMPAIEQFVGSEEYYSTFFHELTHSTGHKDRLNRKEVIETSFFGSPDYGQEELTAELTAAFICAEIGISNESQERNSIAYLKSWMNTIKADKKMFIMAAARANKAAKYIMNVPASPEPEEIN